MHPIVDEMQMGAAIARLAGDRTGEKGAAMIGIMARDEMALLPLAAPALVVLDQPHRRVIGRRPAAGEEDMVQRPGSEPRQARGQLGGGNIGGVDEGVEEGEAARLVGDGRDDLLAAIAHIDAPEPGDSVEIALAGNVIDEGALAAPHDEGAVLLEGIEMRPGMKEVVAILAPDILRVDLIEAGDARLRHDVRLPLSPIFDNMGMMSGSQDMAPCAPGPGWGR